MLALRSPVVTTALLAGGVVPCRANLNSSVCPSKVRS